MKQLLKNAKIVLPDGVEDGYLLIDDGLIASVTHEMPAENIDRIIDLEGRYVSPGFVEIHTHGAGGADFMDGTVDAYLTACRTHLQHGTTTIYPTLLAASNEELQQSMDCFWKAKPLLESMGVTAPGLHLEGPYLNREQKGAINDLYIRDPDAKEYEMFLEQYGDLIARWTIAPELNGALKLGKTLSQNKIVASIGHSNAVYSQVADAVAHGFTHVTHLYSAMSTIIRRHGFRYSGVLESSFCLKGLSVEIIADGCHLPAELLRMVYELIGPDRVALICDSMRCAGQNVKSSYLGSLESGVPEDLILSHRMDKLFMHESIHFDLMHGIYSPRVSGTEMVYLMAHDETLRHWAQNALNRNGFLCLPAGENINFEDAGKGKYTLLDVQAPDKLWLTSNGTCICYPSFEKLLFFFHHIYPKQI